MFINNAGTNLLHILNDFTLTSGGALVVSNAAVRVGDGLFGGHILVDGSVSNLAGGLIVAAGIHVGFAGSGSLTVNGGTVKSDLLVATFGNATGAVWLTSRLLDNGVTRISYSGVGQMTVSNGTWLADLVVRAP